MRNTWQITPRGDGKRRQRIAGHRSGHSVAVSRGTDGVVPGERGVMGKKKTERAGRTYAFAFEQTLLPVLGMTARGAAFPRVVPNRRRSSRRRASTMEPVTRGHARALPGISGEPPRSAPRAKTTWKSPLNCPSGGDPFTNREVVRRCTRFVPGSPLFGVANAGKALQRG